MKEYTNNGNLKVYLAGPFFNDEQVSRIEFIEDALLSHDFDVFSPRMASKISKNSTMQDMIDTFNGNVTHIDECDFVLAILDGYGKSSDTGTVFEAGYAYSINKPVLYFNETRDKKPNLMLALSGKLPFITKTTDPIKDPRDVLADALSSIKNNGLKECINQTKITFKEVE